MYFWLSINMKNTFTNFSLLVDVYFAWKAITMK